MGGHAEGRRPAASTGPLTAPDGADVVRVLPDVTGIDKEFDYRAAGGMRLPLTKGALVKVPLGGRIVRGWVVETGVAATPALELREVADVVSLGPSPEVVDVGAWAAWRWAGRRRPFLVAGSPRTRVRHLPAPARRPSAANAAAAAPEIAALVDEALGLHSAVVRLPPAASRMALVSRVLESSPGDRAVLVIVPTRADADRLAVLLTGAGHPVARHPEQWDRAAAGGAVVVGSRAAALASCGPLAAVVVLDAHSEAYIETRAPTWNAAVLARERARRAGVPCLLVSPCPSLELLRLGTLVTPAPAVELAGWPQVEVIDRRGDDPRAGLFSSRVVSLARGNLASAERPVVFVLNRTGRARLLACGRCGSLARCEICGAALLQPSKPGAGAGGAAAAERLVCPRCSTERPLICSECGSTRTKALRLGTARAREELEALLSVPVIEVTSRMPAGGDVAPIDGARALVGTEAVLHRVRSASLVVFLDIDQELLAPRLRAAEGALALLAAAARLVGGRRHGGRVAVQTRLPEHEVLQGARLGDPGLVSAPESEHRRALRLPPERAVALVTGEGTETLVAALRRDSRLEVAELAGPGAGGPSASAGALVRASDHEVLCGAFAEHRDLAASCRVEVDPHRL